MDDLLKARKMKMTNLSLGDLYCDVNSPLSEVKVMFKYYYWVIEVNVGVVLHMPSYAYNEVKNVCTIFKKRGGGTLWERCWDASFNQHKMFNVWNVIKSISQKMRSRSVFKRDIDNAFIWNKCPLACIIYTITGFIPFQKSPVSLAFHVEELCHDSFLFHSMKFLVYSESPQYII